MEVTLNWVMILVMTVVTFALGALWHGPLFGKLWMKIHHGEKKMTDSEMKKSMEGMWKIMLAEFIATFFMVITLDFLIKILPTFTSIHIAFLVWIGFVLPTIISTVLWGNDLKKWMFSKVAISSVCRLIGLVAAGYVLSMV